MNDEYLEIYGRIFVNSCLGLREVQVDEKIANKLKLENLTGRLFYELLQSYSNHIFKLQQDLIYKKRKLVEAKEQSSKKRRNIIISECVLVPFASLFMNTIVAYAAGAIDVWYNFVEALTCSSWHITLSGTGAITTILLMAMGIWVVPEYRKAKREVPILEKEIPLLEQEISDRQQEQAILEEKEKRQETVTLDTPGELHSLKDYDEKISNHLTSRFAEIDELEDAKRTLLELLQTKEIENFLAANGFTSEEAATASAELEKRFALQPIQPQKPNQQ